MLASLALLLASSQAATTPVRTAPCTSASSPLPAGMEGWVQPVPAMASASPKAATLLPIGTGVTAALQPTPTVVFAVVPKKPGDPNSNGGFFAFVVPTAGRYHVALGSGAWVDVLRGTTSMASVAHAHGAACSTVRKIVDFDLEPGRYLLQIAGNETATLRLMVSRP